MTQLELHKKIDDFLSEDPQKSKVDDGVFLMSQNNDGKEYFFTKADDRWINWLWKNNFLDEIKKPAEDLNQYRYRTPEITYLVNVAKNAPEKVVEIMLSPETATTKEKFKPELIDQFIRICGSLDAKNLALVIPKIHEQEWVKLMGNFNHWGFEYEKMFKTLSVAQDYDNLTLLAEAILAIRSKEEVDKTSNGFGSDNPFYFRDIDQTGVFEFLADIPESFLEKAVRVVMKVVSEIILLGDRNEDSKRVFPIDDKFYLYDVNFFTIYVGQKDPISYRDSVRELAAVAKMLITRLIQSKQESPSEVQRIYESHIDPLPESRSMWRFRLYCLSICPEPLKDKLKSAYFRVFDVEDYYQITGGAEYEELVKERLGILSDAEQREYIEKVFTYFGNREDDPRGSYKTEGSTILSVASKYLTTSEKEMAISLGFEIMPEYEPRPSMSRSMAGVVVPQGPISQEQFDQLSVEEIANNLRTIWKPEALLEEFRGDNPLKPRDAEGVGNLLKNTLTNRLQNFIDNAEMFFERDDLDTHYTYAFLRGIENIIRTNRTLANETNWDGLIKLLVKIKDSGELNVFEQKREHDFDRWLANWTSVHDAITDVIQQLLLESGGKIPVDFSKHRDDILNIISYLLTYPDPTPRTESLEDPVISTMEGEKKLVSDPHSIAINTVRGRAFQALVYFIYPDGKNLTGEIKIQDDVKELYEKTLLDENTRALFFMFGYYLAQFYFRDSEWIQKLIPQIFPEDPKKSHLYLAAWEGYLSSNLYKEIFEDSNIQPLYYRGINISNIKETDRKYSKDPEEGLADHLALAFMHYSDEFNFEHPLFKAFWEQGTLVEHRSFIDFLGRSYVTGGNVDIDNFVSKNKSAKENLKLMWEWVLEKKKEPEIFEEFGFWVNTTKDIFGIAWLADMVKKTLKESSGKFKRDYELTRSIVTFSEKTPADALKIAELILLIGGVRKSNERRIYYIESEWQEALTILYKNPQTKNGTYRLINSLVEEGGSTFWPLKSIIEE